MGGAVGLIATQGMTKVDGFISVEGNLVAQDCGLVSRRIAESTPEEFTERGYRELLDRLEHSKDADLRAWARWYAACSPAAVHGTARSLVEWSDSGKLIRWFNTLPTSAYLYGDRDDRYDYLIPLLPPDRVFTISESDHFPMIDNPATCTRR